MPFYFHKIPSFVPLLYPQRTWKINTSQKEIYLTFDDGPHPEITPQLISILSKFHAKVTFFQLGSKVIQYPELSDLCKVSGHAVANHGYYHIDACKSKYKDFIKNVEMGSETVKSDLFRPPFGRLHWMAKLSIYKKHKVIMWNVMPGDFDDTISEKECLENIKSSTSNGSIIVFHENQKSKIKVLKIIPELLAHYSNMGYSFKSISTKVL